eukprot:SAG31_NODE_11842_length_993_cov_1.233781_2_plen_134_part_01
MHSRARVAACIPMMMHAIRSDHHITVLHRLQSAHCHSAALRMIPMAHFLALLAFVGAVPTTPASATEKNADGAGTRIPSAPVYFPGSQILSAKQGSTLNGLAGLGTTQNWTMCYSSFTNDSSTPAVYHKQCDKL